MSAFTTVNAASPVPPPSNGAQPSHSPTVSHEPAHDLGADDDSILSTPPPETEHMGLGMQMDGVIEHHEHAEHPENATDEPNPKKRKRYNDPPNEVHAELRRPQLPGQWYSKTPEQWEELSHLHKLIYSHVGRIEETDLGEEVEPCEACRKRGFKCMKYKQDHPEVEKLYKGNVRVGTSCTRCRRYRRTCALPGKKPNGVATTPNRPQSISNGYGPPPGTAGSDYKHEGDGLNSWEDTLLAAASGGSPLTSVASSPAPEYHEPPSAPLPPPAHPQQPLQPLPPPQHHERHIPQPHRQVGLAPGLNRQDIEDAHMAVSKVAFLDKVKAVEDELNSLRASQVDFNKERRHWHDQKRDLQAEIYHLREDQRKTREEHWQLQTKLVQMEKDSVSGKGVDMDRLMAEAELKVENRQLKARINALDAQQKESKSKFKELKKANKTMKKKLAELGHAAPNGSGGSGGNNGVADESSSLTSSDSSDSSSDDSSSVDENTRVFFDDSDANVGQDVH